MNGELTKSLIGSPYWMAPEVAMRKGHGCAADIWSFGCVLIEMITGNHPWYNIAHDPKRVIELLSKSGKLPNLPVASAAFNDILRMCIKRNPADRPTAEELLLHGFL